MGPRGRRFQSRWPAPRVAAAEPTVRVGPGCGPGRGGLSGATPGPPAVGGACRHPRGPSRPAAGPGAPVGPQGQVGHVQVTPPGLKPRAIHESRGRGATQAGALVPAIMLRLATLECSTRRGGRGATVTQMPERRCDATSGIKMK